MKIILISPQYIGTITGSGGLYALELSRELAIRNYDVSVLTFGIKDAPEAEEITLDVPEVYKGKKKCSVKVRRFFTADSGSIRSPFEGSKDDEIRRLKEFCELVLKYLDRHVKERTLILLNGHFMIPSLAKELVKFERFRVVSSIHTLESITEAKKESDGAGRKLISYIQSKEREALQYSHFLILCSEAVKEEISWIFPDMFEKLNIRVIPYGIPSGFVEDTKLNDEKMSHLKEKYGISHNLIFNLNRIDPSKGLEYLISAFPAVMKKLKKHNKGETQEYSLLIAGLLEEKNIQYYDRLKKMISNIKDEQVRSSIRLSTDPSIINDKKYLHKMAKVFIIPSIVSPFGMSLIEAVIKGVPFVASGIEGNLEVVNITEVQIPYSIVAGGTVVNFLNPMTRVDYLVDALFYVLTNYSKVKDSLDKLRRQVIKKYSWRNIIEKNISLYDEVMGQ
ncbi:MAG: glycosyltransferase family 4 protein [Spirochaetes bacterium]|nr:glycosyltransferase family 4 protein [Spirochaetota bacterium]